MRCVHVVQDAFAAITAPTVIDQHTFCAGAAHTPTAGSAIKLCLDASCTLGLQHAGLVAGGGQPAGGGCQHVQGSLVCSECAAYNTAVGTCIGCSNLFTPLGAGAQTVLAVAAVAGAGEICAFVTCAAKQASFSLPHSPPAFPSPDAHVCVICVCVRAETPAGLRAMILVQFIRPFLLKRQAG